MLKFHARVRDRTPEPVGFLFENIDDPDRQPDPFAYDATVAIALIVLVAALLAGVGIWFFR